MSPVPQVLQFLVVAVAGWINQQPRDVIDSLQEENRVLREPLGPGRLRFTDAQRRRLAAQAKRLGRRVRRDLHTLVTPDTLLRWVLTPLYVKIRVQAAWMSSWRARKSVMTRWEISRARKRFRHRMISRLVRPSAVRRATSSTVG